MSTAFHPQTDGQTERMNRLIEETLRHYVCYAQNDWDLNIQLVAFAINNAKNESIGASPFFLNKGLHPRMPCGISLFPSAPEVSPKATKNLKIKGDSGTSMRQKSLPRFIGPYAISELVGKAAVKLLLPKGY